MITVKYKFPNLRLDDLLDITVGSHFFLKIDLLSEYYQVRICKCNLWKTTFKLKDELFKWLVISFGLF